MLCAYTGNIMAEINDGYKLNFYGEVDYTNYRELVEREREIKRLEERAFEQVFVYTQLNQLTLSLRRDSCRYSSF